MTIRPSEIQITKVSDASTPLLFSGDAFVFDGTKAGGDVQPYMEWKLKEVLISGVIENGDTAVDPNNPNVDDGGIIIEGGIPTETIRPMESLDDGGIIIIGGFPTEMIRPMESLRDGGLVIDWFPTETIRPMESLHSFELLI